jgi:hypothetical protein
MSIEVIDLARETGATIVTFPPHCTHKLQLLDVGVYKAFKTYEGKSVNKSQKAMKKILSEIFT